MFHGDGMLTEYIRSRVNGAVGNHVGPLPFSLAVRGTLEKDDVEGAQHALVLNEGDADGIRCQGYKRDKPPEHDVVGYLAAEAMEEEEEAQLDCVDTRDAEDSLDEDAVQRLGHVFEESRRHGNGTVGNIFEHVHIMELQLSDTGCRQLDAKYHHHDPILGQESAEAYPPDV
jgi:hypothetical protein